ncbi:MAG: NUDIX domain-containing protein [Bacteroidia bacterium]|nr:NUDIX domain-containing protein [Bacteroidia bacterium]
MSDEYFPIVDESGLVIGMETRKYCHGGSFLLHPVVHLHIFDSKGRLYLQKRAQTKDIQPGKWDTSVGGHIDYGETVNEALIREVREELSIVDFDAQKIFSYTFRSTREYELVNSFYTIYEGLIKPDSTEICEGRFWTIEEIESKLGMSVFTPNFEFEFAKIKSNGLINLLTNKND